MLFDGRVSSRIFSRGGSWKSLKSSRCSISPETCKISRWNGFSAIWPDFCKVFQIFLLILLRRQPPRLFLFCFVVFFCWEDSLSSPLNGWAVDWLAVSWDSSKQAFFSLLSLSLLRADSNGPRNKKWLFHGSTSKMWIKYHITWVIRANKVGLGKSLNSRYIYPHSLRSFVKYSRISAYSSAHFIRTDNSCNKILLLPKKVKLYRLSLKALLLGSSAINKMKEVRNMW